MIEIQNKEDILIISYKINVRLELDIAKQLVAQRLAYQNGKEYPAVFYLKHIKSITKEARSYMNKEGAKGITLRAFVVKNNIEKILLRFFLGIEKPLVPSNYFINEEDAIAWIKEAQNKNNSV